MVTFIANLFRGVAVGLANIIPGVSGGTMLLILGVYERVIRAIRNIDAKTLLGLVKGRKSFAESVKRLDAWFMMALAVGAMVAVVAVSKLMVYLLNKQHDPTYGFFFGLVLASVIVPWRMIKKKTVATFVIAAIAAAGVVGLTFAMSNETRLASAQKRAALKAAKKKAKAAHTKVDTPKVPVTGRKLALFAGAGAIAIAAMILPGISGSFLLLLMGVYFDVLASISSRTWPLLGAMTLGCLLGLVLFTRLLNWLLEKHHDLTIAFLLGLVVGSLWAIWPFKTFGMAGEKRVDLANTLPAGLGSNELLTLGTVVVGCVIVGIFVWLEKRHPKEDVPA